MGRDFSLALPFFHCFSGCDSTSAFYNKSKKVMYKAWKQYPKQLEITEAFKVLSWTPDLDDVHNKSKCIKDFISYMYISEFLDLKVARF